jgi:four helix bundle protein
MATIKCFEDILAWQKAQDLAILVDDYFGEIRNFSFKDQIIRASVSVSNNIAEGFDRGSDAEFRRFLFIARGSCSETKSMCYLAQRKNYISATECEKLLSLCSEVSRLTNGLIKALSTERK